MENNYQLTRIHNYLTGLMDPEQMHELEREALNDPFLQEALDGYKLQNGVDTKQMSVLQRRLASRIDEKAVLKNGRFYNWQRLAVALTSGVLFLVVCTLLLFKHFDQPRVEKKTDVMLMEEEMRISSRSLAGSDAIPMQGWEGFNEELNSEIRDFKGSGLLTVEFIISENRASRIEFNQSNEEQLKATISNFLVQKTQWKGKRAILEIRIQ